MNPVKPSETAFPCVLKRFRAEIGITQQGLADLLEVSRNTIKAWERGDPKRQPHILTQEAVIARLTKALAKATQ